MIFRKPYAFLIRHFKLIHLILVGLTAYVCYKTNNLLGIINANISNTVSSRFNIANTYLDTLLFIMVLLTIVISTIVLVLMRNKKKPFVFYIVLGGFYTLLLFVFLFARSTLLTLEYQKVDIRVLNALRDITMGSYLIQYVLIIMNAIRATGFNIKKFNFARDIDELSISESDNEEFELDIEIDTDDIKAKLRKRLRILKYLYRENKFLVRVIITIIFVSLVILGLNNYFNKEKIYTENEIFRSGSYEIKVLDTYKTKYDYNNNEINSKFFYMIVSLSLKNISGEERILDINNTRIIINGIPAILPATTRYSEFQDLGIPYYGSIIQADETRNIMLVYEIEKEYINSNYYFEYLTSIQGDQYIYTKVNLTPDDFGSKDNNYLKQASLNEKLDFTASIYNDSNITINSVEFNTKYPYKLSTCIKGSCTSSTQYLTASNTEYVSTIMKLNYDINLIGANNKLTGSKFIELFGKIRYVIDDKEYETKVSLKDITPFNIKGYSYIEVIDRVKSASKVYLDFKIRDKKYSYLIYEKI